VVSFTAAGTCVVDANQAGSANWNAAPQVQQSFSVSNPAPLTILSVVRDGGNKKVHFTGSGAVASTTITVTICAVNSFPCAAPVATSISTNPSAGAWTSAASNSNLNGSQTYYARAVQGSRTSAVFTFSTTSL
jgi:large repetitive protein